MNNNNIILQTDFYKTTMYNQYPKGTEFIYSYFESRGGKFDRILFFGLQYYIKKYLTGVVVTEEKIQKAKKIINGMGGRDNLFDEGMWRHILEKHGGKLPIRIKAVPEGMIVPNRNVLFTIENTDPKCFSLTTHLETLLLKSWYTCSVASQSWYFKNMIRDAMNKSGSTDGLEFKLHDFAFRGVSSEETAGLGGAAHLINFLGTDTLKALEVISEYYDGPEISGYSIPASEHSVMCSHGKENESSACENMLDQWPDGLVACVSDQYNIFECCEKIWGEKLKDKVMSRKGTLVIRPDSLDPITTLPKLLDILSTKFGFTVNSKGYKVLPPQVRMIWGDGIDYNTLPGILNAVIESGYSIENVGFGSGGGLLQKLNRDDGKFAVKCSWAQINGIGREVYKEPFGQDDKKSKRGRLELTVDNENRWRTVPEGTTQFPMLKTVFEDGVLVKEYNFAEVKANAATS